MNERDIQSVLNKVASEYPTNIRDTLYPDIPRVAFNISLALRFHKYRAPATLQICDLGGGVGLFSVGCAALGFKRTVLLDDFSDPATKRAGDKSA